MVNWDKVGNIVGCQSKAAPRVGDQTIARGARTREGVPSMALAGSAREADREVLPDPCIHRATGRVRGSGGGVAAGCPMRPEARATDAGRP
jgi:hypothetical protein